MSNDFVPTKKEKILIIEGDVSLAENMASSLRRDGYSVTVVTNGEDGLKTIYDDLPHLILLDIVIQGVDGYEILSKKQSEPMLKKIPVFLISSQGVPINIRKVPAGSVSEFIINLKIEPSEVNMKVDRFFKNETIDVESLNSSSVIKRKILWVEDDKFISSILSRKLISSGFDLYNAKNGEEALLALKQYIPNIIILDLLLPGMTGFDILQKIKQDQNVKNIPVLILSNLSKPSDMERAKIMGASNFVVKAAVSLEQIVDEINHLC